MTTDLNVFMAQAAALFNGLFPLLPIMLGLPIGIGIARAIHLLLTDPELRAEVVALHKPKEKAKRDQFFLATESDDPIDLDDREQWKVKRNDA